MQRDEYIRCLAIILSAEVTPQNEIIREQVIGEARAYDTCIKYPQKIYNQIVKQQQEKDKQI